MAYPIQDLLVKLYDEKTLRNLPCFYDKQEQIQFRLGQVNGTHAIFSPETGNNYSFQLRNNEDKENQLTISDNDKIFKVAQSIHLIIRMLKGDEDYITLRGYDFKNDGKIKYCN